MSQIMLRPDLKTAGGEVCDIVCDGRYVGSVTLVYREGDRICGSVQLDEEMLSGKKKAAVVSHVQQYVQSMADAVEAMDCDVLVTYGRYDHVIQAPRDMAEEDEFEEEETKFNDVDPFDREEMSMLEDELNDDGPEVFSPHRYELVIVGESRSRIEYHIYDEEMEWVAEAFVTIEGDDVLGDIQFNFEPADDEIEAVTDLLVSDFDQDTVDSFNLHIKYKGTILETIELTHESLLDDDEYRADPDDVDGWEVDSQADNRNDSEVTVVLARDDGDMLTYEIFEPTHGGLAVGTATIDITSRNVSGFIDLREENTVEGREQIASRILSELDKERDYDSVNLTVMYKNRPIDEMLYELDPVH